MSGGYMAHFLPLFGPYMRRFESFILAKKKVVVLFFL